MNAHATKLEVAGLDEAMPNMSRFAMSVDAYMTTPVHHVPSDTPLAAVAAELAARRISCLAVVDHERIVGVVSRTDLLRVGRCQTMRRPFSAVLLLPERPASMVMSSNVATVTPRTSIRDAAASMIARRLHRVFVVDDDMRPLGVLSTKDVMSAVSDQRVMLPIERFMSAPIFTVRAGEPLALGIERLELAQVSGVVVVEEDWPVGVFTGAESLAAADMPRNTPIEEVMSPSLLCMNVATPLHRAAAQAAATCGRRVIATADGRMKGILTGLDFARATQA